MVSYAQLLRKKSYLSLIVIAIIIHLLYLGALQFGYLKKFCSDSTIFFKVGADFFSAYEAGWDFLHGRNLYHHDELAEDLQAALARGEQRAPYYTTYRYPPHFAATIGVLLNLFPPITAYIFWILLNEITLLFNIELARRLTNKPLVFCWSLVFWLTPFPLYIEYWMGQFSLFMSSLVWWSILLFLRQRRILASLFWFYASSFKLFSSTFVTLYYRQRWLREILICAAFILVPTLVYFYLFPAGSQQFFFNH